MSMVGTEQDPDSWGQGRLRNSAAAGRVSRDLLRDIGEPALRLKRTHVAIGRAEQDDRHATGNARLAQR
eukprot:gene18616-22432_t